MKPISIIIPTLNEEDYLPRLLQSFADQDYKGIYEIIVVDGHSTDNTVGVIKDYQKLLPNLLSYQCEKGTSRQRNYGAKKAKYDSLIFLDGDMEVPKNSLRKIEKHFQTKENFIATPFLFPYDWKIADIFIVGMGMIYFLAVRKTNPVLAGMCIITTKQVHERIGGFNERAIVAEDVDYGLRAFRSSAKYFIFFRTFIRGSARRFDKMGRLQVGRLYMKWYKETVEHGAITDATKFNYEFGKFKKE